MTDEWDPNVLFACPPAPCRIYGDDQGELFALVDQEDYQFLVQWKWLPKWSRGGRKVYLRRTAHTGTRLVRTQRTIWLHHAVMERIGTPRPTPFHILDHRDGDSLNCRRENLRWVTVAQNNQNRFGSHKHHDWD